MVCFAQTVVQPQQQQTIVSPACSVMPVQTVSTDSSVKPQSNHTPATNKAANFKDPNKDTVEQNDKLFHDKEDFVPNKHKQELDEQSTHIAEDNIRTKDNLTKENVIVELNETTLVNEKNISDEMNIDNEIK